MAFYDSIKLEKGMYGNGRSLTDILEELDPSENYKNTDMEGLDAFQRQLKRYDIKVGGAYSDQVQKFFETSNSAALFPEYVARAVKQGIQSADMLSDIIAAKTIINGLDYRSIAASPIDDETSSVVNEGGTLPSTDIRTNSNLVSLKKRGRILTASYESVKYQRLDIFTVTLRQIGAYIAREQLKDAVNVLINGDGGNNAAEIIPSGSSNNTLTYDSLIKLWASLSPYELNTILAPTDLMQQLLSMSEMRDANAGLDFQGTGKMITPMGAKLIHTPFVTDKKIIGLDKNCALEMIQSGDIVIDSDRLIDRQLDRTTISCTAGFSKIFKDSAKVLSV